MINDASKGSNTVVEGSKAAGKPEKAAVSDSASSKDDVKDSKVSEKKASAMTPNAACGKSAKTEKDADVVQKDQGGNGKKGKRKGKGKKGKGGQGDNTPSGSNIAEKTDDKLDRENISQTKEKDVENKSCDKHVDEQVSEKEAESENSKDVNPDNQVKEAEAQSDSSNIITPSDIDSNVKPASAEELKEGSVTDSPSKMSVAEKGDLLKSPSSQSITRMNPDQSEREDKEPAGSTQQAKVYWFNLFTHYFYRLE